MQKQIQAGVRPQAPQADAIPTHAPVCPVATPADSCIDALREEMQSKLQAMATQFEASISSVQKDVGNTV